MESLAIDASQPLRFVLVHSLLLVFAVGAVLALFLRSRRPARGRHVFYWLLLIPAGLFMGSQLKSDAHVAPFAYGLAGFVSILGLFGAGLSYTRWLQGSDEPQTALAFTMLAATSLLTLLMLPATPSARVASLRTQCKNNLKQIGLALHNFTDEFGALPSPVVGNDPPRSWRVEILPFLDQAPLRASYRDNATWDSAANLEPGRKGQMYVCPSMAEPYDDQQRTLTCYAAVTGPNSVFAPDNRPRFPDVPDGSSTTIAIIEAAGRHIAWTDPRDVDLATSPIGLNLPGTAPKQSPAIGSSPHTGGCHVTMVDGSVRFISQNIDPEVLKKLLTADGGESMANDEF